MTTWKWGDSGALGTKLAKRLGLEELCAKLGIPFERDVFHLRPMGQNGSHFCGLSDEDFVRLQRYMNHGWVWHAGLTEPFKICPRCSEQETIRRTKRALENLE